MTSINQNTYTRRNSTNYLINQSNRSFPNRNIQMNLFFSRNLITNTRNINTINNNNITSMNNSFDNNSDNDNSDNDNSDNDNSDNSDNSDSDNSNSDNENNENENSDELETYENVNISIIENNSNTNNDHDIDISDDIDMPELLDEINTYDFQFYEVSQNSYNRDTTYIVYPNQFNQTNPVRVYNNYMSNDLNNIINLLLINDSSSVNNYYNDFFNYDYNNIQNNSLYDIIPIKNIITEEDLNTLNEIKYKHIDNKENYKMCPITHEEFDDDDDVIQLPCNHVFLKEPIIYWLKNEKGECPSCRYKFNTYSKSIYADQDENINTISNNDTSDTIDDNS
jgi:hypothetical protein